MERVAVGIMVHNEAENLPRLLTGLCAHRSPRYRLDPIVIVSSGSDDDSDIIVQGFVAADPRVELVREARRLGKARAINRFLEHIPPEVKLCVLVGGDVLPADDAWDGLLLPFSNPRVGMTGARPCPTNPPAGALNRLVRFQWAVHHRVASRRPKLGELVAFRRLLHTIPPDTAADEATLEALITEQGFQLVYVPQAVVHNHGPHTLREFLAQRRRIWVGHLWLKRRTGYRVSTYSVRDLLRPVAEELWDRPQTLPTAILAGMLEAGARLGGTLDHLLLGRDLSVWPVQPSTKRVWRG